VCERREIAACADTALRWNQWHRIGVDKALQGLDDQRSNARMAAPEAQQLEEDHQTGDVPRERVAKSGTVRQDQVGLELGQSLIGNARVGKQSEAGVDAVDGLAPRDDALDCCRGLADAPHRRIVKTGFDACPQTAKLIERDLFRIQLHAVTIGRSSRCSRAQSIAIS